MGAQWNSWGEERPALSRRGRALLQAELGPLTPARAVPLSAARVPASRLAAATLARLRAALGEEAVRVDDESRARHAGGQAYPDVMRRRRGDASAAPDAVVLPADGREVAAVLDICADAAVAVVPWGGGTSVVGGLDAVRGRFAAVVALDLRRLDDLLAVDPVARTATFEAGVRTPAAEAALAAHGLTLGHLPQSYEQATLGGYAVTRSAGQASSGVGRFDDLLVGCELVCPAGTVVLPAQPASAAGPDLRRLVLGSEGTLGVVTTVTVRVRPQPAHSSYEGWMLPTWSAGLEAMRVLAQDGPRPDVARLSDADETRVSLALSGAPAPVARALSSYLRLRRVAGGCLVITGYDGTSEEVRARRGRVRRVLRRHGAVLLGAPVGRSWEHGRFGGPYLRDTLLDAGVLVETLETAAQWPVLPEVHRAVSVALRGALGTAAVGCHVSHLYPTGASLYFTVLAAADAAAPVEQWAAAKHAANEAIVAAGATITHHHGVGTVHREHVAADLGGDLGVAALRAVKSTLDPVGILNPGKLLPEA